MSKFFNRVHRDRMDDVILAHLKDVGNITAMEANGLYKCRSLSRRITSIKRKGHVIRSVPNVDRTGQRYVRYHYIGLTDGAKVLKEIGR